MAEVGCAGILVADTFCGPLERLPREGELLRVEGIPSHAGGCAANVALDLARQGISADVCGCVGQDDAAEVVLGSLRAAGIGHEQVRRLPSHPTSKTVILLVKGQDRRYLHSFGANAAFQVAEIPRSWLDGLKVFYLGGLFAMPSIRVDELAELLQYCRTRKIVTVVDVVVPQDYSGLADLRPLLPHIDYFLPNDDEAERLTGQADRERQIEAFLSHGVGTVLVTCGRDGCTAAQKRERWTIAAHQVPSIDPSGSGDAFDAGIITGILRGWDMPRMLRFAAALGASATTALGTTEGVFTAEQAETFLAEHPLEVQHETVDS